MSGFQFPPPPPPPPKAAREESQYEPTSRESRGRGRDRGEYRGIGRGRGRGRGNSFQPTNSHASNNSAGSPGSQSSHYHGFQQSQSLPLTLPNLPAGAYINPRFTGNLHGTNRQTISSVAAYEQDPKPELSSFTSPSRTIAGHKRKLEALRGPHGDLQRDSQHSETPTALPVPSFGNPILPAKPRLNQSNNWQTQARSVGNALGLTPGAGEARYPSSDEEPEEHDVDEESMYAELGSKLTFEHNGSVMSLSSTADLLAWQEERKRNWPTKRRMAEREAERQRIGTLRKKLLANASLLANGTDLHRWEGANGRIGAGDVSQAFTDRVPEAVASKPESKLERARREMAERTLKLEALRKQVAKSEAYLEKVKASHAEEDDERVESAIKAAEVAANEEAGQDAEASEVKSGDESESSVVSSDSSAAEDSDDDDEPPEETTSKGPAPDSASSGKPICRYFVASGYCRDGDACRFRHELPARGSGGQQTLRERQPMRPQQDAAPKLENVLEGDKRSLYQRLMDQQELEEDRLALQVIKHLGSVGFFDPQDANEGA